MLPRKLRFNCWFNQNVRRLSGIDQILSTIDKFESKRGVESVEKTIRIIGNGYMRSPKSFLLSLGEHKFLINCPENTSRALLVHQGVYWSKILDIFLTRSSWNRCFSGLFDMIYRLTAINNFSTVRFHAPFDAPQFLYYTYRLLKLKSIRFERHQYETLGAFDIESVKVDHVPLDGAMGFIFSVKNETAYRIFVLDLPNRLNLDQFVKLGTEFGHIDLFVHLSDEEIRLDPKYIDHVNRASNKNTTHLIFNEKSAYQTSKKNYLRHMLLNALDSSVFPCLPPSKSVPKDENLKLLYGKTQIDAQPETIICLNTGFIKQSVPDVDLDREYPFYRDRLRPSNPEISGNTPKTYPEIVFLGTSSTHPTLSRNVSSILVNVSQHQSILMDIGQGTISQFVKFYGDVDYQRAITKIKAVFMSHFHADHHTGLFEMIGARKGAFESLGLPYERLYVCLSNNLRPFFESINKFSDEIPFKELVHLIDNNDLLAEKKSSSADILRKSIGLEQIQTCPVKHVPSSMGLIINTVENCKLVYSGDCVPSEELIKRGRDCDILIHEATYGDSKAGMALAQKLMHSTVSQAVDVGSKMNAKYVVLTHFSSWLSKYPELLYPSNQSNLVIADDFMRLDLSNIGRIPSLAPKLKRLNPTKLNLNSLKDHFFK